MHDGKAGHGDARRAGGRDYRAFVLRLWRDGGGAGAWRYSLEDPATHQRRGFADVEALAAYLRATGPAEPPDGS